jgi:excinuclease ABC subunit C
VASALDRVPGIGPARRAALLRAFGSVAAVRAAGAEEIARRARLPRELAGRVAAHLALEAPAAAGPGFAPSPADAGHGAVLDRGPRGDGGAGSGTGSASGGKG